MRTPFSEASPLETPVGPSDLYYDPYDYEIDANPHPIWRRMRDEAPLYRNDRYDFFALSRFDDVLAASLDSETYSSAHGTVLEMMSESSAGSSAMMIWMDPPDHTRLRQLVNRAFTPRAIERLEEKVHRICTRLLVAQSLPDRVRIGVDLEVVRVVVEVSLRLHAHWRSLG